MIQGYKCKKCEAIFAGDVFRTLENGDLCPACRLGYVEPITLYTEEDLWAFKDFEGSVHSNPKYFMRDFISSLKEQS